MYTCFSISVFLSKNLDFHSVCFRYKTSSGLETEEWLMNFCWGKSCSAIFHYFSLYSLGIDFLCFQPIPLEALKVGLFSVDLLWASSSRHYAPPYVDWSLDTDCAWKEE